MGRRHAKQEQEGLLSMSERTRIAIIAGCTMFIVRIVIGLLIMGLDRLTHESDMLLLCDLPTIAVYFVLAKVGHPHDIANAYDLTFFATGAVVWLVLGFIVGWVTSLLRSRSDGSTLV
jgi:hypothetical protein